MYCYIHCPQHCSRPPPTHASLETPGHLRTSLGQSLVGSRLLSPGSWCTQGSVCALQESVSQSQVSSVGSMVRLMVTSSKRAYATPRSAAPRAPAPVAGHCWPIPPQETLKHSSVSVSVESPGTHKVCLSPECLWQIWCLILNAVLLLLHLAGSSPLLWREFISS